MSYERRGLRPFDGLDRTQTLLNHLVRVQSPPIPDGFQPPLGNQGLTPLGLRAGTGAIAAAGGTLVLDPIQFTTDAIGLYFGVNDDDWREFINVLDDDLRSLFGVSRHAPVSILVTATNTRLNQVVRLLQIPYAQFAMEDDWRRVIVEAGDTDRRPRPFRMPMDGCTIRLQLVIHEDIPEPDRQPGKPWRKGSWLAKVDIRVKAARGSGLAPRPLTPEARARFGIGDRSSVYVHFPAGCEGLSRASDLSDRVSVFIDEGALAKASTMNANGHLSTPAGDALFMHWVIDTFRALVSGFLRDDELPDFDVDDDESRDTFLYGLLQQVSDSTQDGETAVSIEEALNILRDHPERFIALIEHSLDRLASDEHLLQLRKGPR